MTDFIIVGGGSAGCVLANRLSADPAAEVVLLEAGGWDTSPFIHMPVGFLQLMKTGQLDWGYHTEPQANLDNRRMFWPRGKVLGGSSAINGMIYIRGNAADYDSWAQAGNSGWSFSDCLPYFRRAENWQSGAADNFHGADGPLQTFRHGIRHELARAFVQAGRQAGYPETDDFNGAGQEGFGPCDSTVSKRNNRTVRSSTAAAYLRPVRRRPNLTIITRALATRVLVENGRAVGVEYLRRGKLQQLRTRGEVILSGGAINSPQLLQLSGIGDPEVLGALDIPVVADLPGVGANLQDHLALGLMQRCTQPITMHPLVQPLNSLVALGTYIATGGGPAAHHGVEALAFLKTRAGLEAPDLQYHLILIMYDDHGRHVFPEYGFMLYFNLTRPQSLGTITIRSRDPRVQPAIQPNYFSAPADLELMRRGVRLSREIIAQQAFDPYRGTELLPGAAVASDAEIDSYLRGKVESIYHPVGTCKMGADPMAVVDDRLRVHGVESLRVVDASIMPTITTGNTNAPTIMITEKAADFILGRELVGPDAGAMAVH